MPRSGMHVVKALPPAASLNARIRRRLKLNLTPLAQKHAFLRQRLVSGWSPVHRPRFRGVVDSDTSIVTLTIFVVNGEVKVRGSATTVFTLWTWWEKTGTRPHKIRGFPLAFEMQGRMVFAHVVNHPGTTPKRKTPPLNKRLSASVAPLLLLSVKEGLK